jgi:hypothetical protein
MRRTPHSGLKRCSASTATLLNISCTVGDFIEAITHFVDGTTIQKFHNNQKTNLVLDEQLDLHTATSIAADMGFQGVDGQFLLQGHQQGDMESVYTLSKGETAAYLYKLYFHKELVELEA